MLPFEILCFEQILCIPHSGGKSQNALQKVLAKKKKKHKKNWQNELREMLITNNSISFDNEKYWKTNQ